MLMPPNEYLSREEMGEQDAALIAAFRDRLTDSDLDEQTADNIAYQYAVHLMVSTREAAKYGGVKIEAR